MNLSKLMVIFLLALLSACSLTEPMPEDASSYKSSLPQELEKTDAKLILNDIWVLESILGEKAVLEEVIQRPQLEIQLRDMKLMGNDGCNGFFANIDYLDNEKILLGPIAGTRMFCHPMDVPDRFNQQLNNVKSYQLKGLKLRFFDSEGEELLQFQKID